MYRFRIGFESRKEEWTESELVNIQARDGEWGTEKLVLGFILQPNLQVYFTL